MTCSTCRHWIASQCKAHPPISSSNGHGVWPTTAPTDSCARHQYISIRPPGKWRKVTDEQILEIIRPAPIARADLLIEIQEYGVTKTPAVKRVAKLLRQGRIQQGPHPDRSVDGLYITVTSQAPAKADKPDQFLSLLREVAPDEPSATSIRQFLRQVEHTLPMSVATTHRKLNQLVGAGLAARNDRGYYALPEISI